MTSLSRRLLFGASVGLTLGVSRSTWAGSYLNRAALLLEGSKADRKMAMPRFHDEELMRVVHRVAKGRTEVGLGMHVPKEVAGMHPHLVLVLENNERGFLSGVERNRKRFTEHLLRARDEDLIFRTLVRKAGYTLPDV